MSNFGFIGFGNMGSMLIRELIDSGKVKENQIIVTRKDHNRLNEVIDNWPKIRITKEIKAVTEFAKYIFLCVKPLEYVTVLEELKQYLQPEQHIISIAGSVSIADLEDTICCKITKIMPTVVSEVNGGITLVCHSSKITEKDSAFIEDLLQNINKIKRVEEKDFGFLSELTSCGPGLLSSVMEEFINTALNHTDVFNKEEIEEMVLQTLSGTIKLMMESKLSFQQVLKRVATKGGITEEGALVLKTGLPKVYEEMFHTTLEKRKIVGEKIHNNFQTIHE